LEEKTKFLTIAIPVKNYGKKFKQDLKIFGDIKTYERTPNTTPCIYFPKVISDTLKHILNIEFTRPNKLPDTILKASEEQRKTFLQALFDDEGCISTSLSIGMKSENIINQIKNMVEGLGIKTNNLTGRKIKYFSIKADNIKKFKEKISFYHPEKIKRLNTRLKIQKRNKTKRTRPLHWTRNKIIKILEAKPTKTIILCEKLLLTVNGLYHHLKYLENQNKIIRKGTKNNTIWEIKV